MRYALIGCGGIARAHASALTLLRADGVELAAAVDTDATSRRLVASTHGCREFESVEAMIAGTEIEAASVCTPPTTHPSIVGALLDAGIHVLCEKPLATTSREADAMVAHARDQGRILTVSSKFRFVSDLIEARRLLDAGVVGKPVDVSITFCAPLDPGRSWHGDPALSGGGVVMDNGPHAYDVLSVLFDEAPIVEGATIGQSANRAVEETARILFTVPDGPMGVITLSWSYLASSTDYVRVNGRGGSLNVGWLGGTHRAAQADAWAAFGSGYDKTRAFQALMARFVASIRGEEEPDSTERPRSAVRFIERVLAEATR